MKTTIHGDLRWRIRKTDRQGSEITHTCRYLFELIDSKNGDKIETIMPSRSPIAPEWMRNRAARMNSAYHLNEMLFGA